MQKLRNCSGKGSPAKIFLNGRVYSRCPMAISLENLSARYLVNLFFRCRDMGQYPADGGPLAQTAFTVELFSFIKAELAEHEKRVARANASKNQ